MGRVISDGFVQNAMALGETWRTRRKDAKIRNAMAGFEEDPEEAARNVFKIDPDMGFKLKKKIEEDVDRKRTLAEHQRTIKMDNLKTIAGYLRGQYKTDPSKLGEAYDGMTPVLKGTLGMSDEEITHYRGAILQNPGMLNQLAGAKDFKPVMSSPGSEMLDEFGNVLHQTPFAPKVLQVPNASGGRDVIQVPVGGGGPAGSVPPPMPSGDTPAPAPTPRLAGILDPSEVPSPAPRAGARTTRLANPGAIKDGEWARSQPGYAGSDGTFARFTTPEAGRAAQVKLLKGNYIDKGFTTPSAIINRYAPVGPENTPEQVRNYIGYVSGKMGLAPNQPVPQERLGEFAGYMSEFEGGNTSGAPAAAPATPSGITPMYSTQGYHKPEKVEPGYRIATRDEKLAAGVDATLPYQISGKGEWKLIGPKPTTGKAKDKPQTPAALEGSLSGLDRLAMSARQLMGHRGLPGITGLTGVFPNLPGGQAADAQAALGNLKSQAAFAVLQNMRDMSKTGGALGNVSNYEIKALEANLAALDKSQSLEAFKRNLKQIIDFANGSKARLRRAFQEAGGTFPGAGAKPPTRAAIARLKGNPSGVERKLFDQVFGAGAAARVLGK